MWDPYSNAALLIEGAGQTDSYIDCASNSGIETLFAEPIFPRWADLEIAP
jgi:hypothetical protein